MNLLLLTLLCSAAPVAYFPAHSTTVSDGDTVSTTVVLTEDVHLAKQSIRAANYDAWENKRNRQSKPFSTFTDAQWKAEIAKGMRARDDLTALLSTGDLYVVITGREVYGRLLGKWYVYQAETDELIDVAKVMAAKGHVRK